MAKITKVNIKTEFITIGQMLIFVDLVSCGREKNKFIQDHKIVVDGVELKMRGKKLYPGTRIEIDDSMIFEIKNDN